MTVTSIYTRTVTYMYNVKRLAFQIGFCAHAQGAEIPYFTSNASF